LFIASVLTCAETKIVNARPRARNKHGPYWYAYSDTGTPKYVGKQLPERITNHVALLQASRPKLKKLKNQIQDRIDKAAAALEKAQRELRTVENLEAGEYIASDVLKSLGLSQFNGHGG
jgi:hypothetical protein